MPTSIPGARRRASRSLSWGHRCFSSCPRCPWPFSSRKPWWSSDRMRRCYCCSSCRKSGHCSKSKRRRTEAKEAHGPRTFKPVPDLPSKVASHRKETRWRRQRLQAQFTQASYRRCQRQGRPHSLDTRASCNASQRGLTSTVDVVTVDRGLPTKAGKFRVVNKSENGDRPRGKKEPARRQSATKPAPGRDRERGGRERKRGQRKNIRIVDTQRHARAGRCVVAEGQSIAII